MSKVYRTISAISFDDWELIYFAMDIIASMNYGATNPNLKVLEEEIIRVKTLPHDQMDEHDWDIILIVVQTMLDTKVAQADFTIQMLQDGFQEIKKKIILAFSH